MKKTLNINLAGYPFTIDEDAYNLLKDYLDTIRYAFETHDDTAELAADIESRVAEILIEKEAGGFRIVSREEISRVIERIGRPSEFIEIEDTVDNSIDSDNENLTLTENIKEEKISPPPYNPQYQYSRNPFSRKKIFRDPENSMLGGVCSGLASYLHIDVTIVRLITVLLFFLSASTVAIAYIILWIVIPEARTPLQRMQMMGEDPTVENIGKTVTENHHKSENQGNVPEEKKGFTGFLSKLFSIFVKCVIILGLVIAIPLIIALGAGLLGCVIAAFVIGVAIIGGISGPSYGMFDSTMEGELVLFILLAVIGGIITVGIPLWLFIRKMWKKKDVNSDPAYRRALLIIWLCGIALVSIFTVKAVKKTHQMEKWSIDYEKLKDLNNLDENDIENIQINSEGVTIETTRGKYKVAKGKVTEEKEEDAIVTDSEIIDEKLEPAKGIQERFDSIKDEEIFIDSIKISDISYEPIN